MPGQYFPQHEIASANLIFHAGCIYLIAMYYKRHELQWRFNVFFSASILAGAVSGVCIS
jgi:hypothetical protein